MAATRVRCLFEFRNGDGHFIRQDLTTPFVPCKGQKEIGPIFAAFMVAAERAGFTAKEVHDHIEKHKRPSHD
jgi:hypothetical protein